MIWLWCYLGGAALFAILGGAVWAAEQATGVKDDRTPGAVLLMTALWPIFLFLLIGIVLGNRAIKKQA